MPGVGFGNGVGLPARNHIRVVAGGTVYTIVTDGGTPIVTDGGDALVTDPQSLIGFLVLGKWILTLAGDWLRII